MPYATRTDLEERYGADEIAQRESALQDGAIDLALADADARRLMDVVKRLLEE